jgi:serine/threonine protein kinase/WD40 repeat protein
MATWDPRANELFLNALEIASPSDRQAYLDKTCGPDAPLRKAVDALLQAHEAAGSILEPKIDAANPPATTGLESPREGAGETIGNYKLLQLIGEGGFGSVFMAEQEKPVRRRVALKIIKLGMDTKQVIARFEAERQALAMMDHPNIAKVLDVGTTDTGRPFFVMELVKGVPITKYCDVNEVSTNDRLELFHAVCLAVQHAHQKGIIHRDLKPSNILVTLRDDKPVPKVIDFGIAKATSGRLTDMTLYTELNQMIGTPQYMSPEQAEMTALDIDTRTDIYSLGAVLYEQLIGTTPLDAQTLRSQSLVDMQRMIREAEPPRPSVKLASLGATGAKIAIQRRTDVTHLGKQLRGDLDWIVLKAMEKDRTRRYDTAQGLALDVRRYLDHEPVLARPPSTGYRVRKFVRKHRVSVTAASLVALALVAGIAGTSVAMVRANRAEQVATEQKNRAVGLLDALKASEGQAERSAAAAIAAKRLADINHARGRITEGNALGASGDWESARSVFAAARTELQGLGLSPKVAEFGLWDSYRNLPPPLAVKSLGNKPVVGVEWLPDGRSAVALAEDGQITIWDVPTGRTLRQFHDKTGLGSSESMALSPDGAHLVTVRNRRAIVIWDVASGAVLNELPQTNSLSHVAFSRDGTRIIAGGAKWAKIIEFPSCTALFEHDASKFISTSKYDFLPLASRDPSLFVRTWYGGVDTWDLQTDKPLATAKGLKLAYGCAAISPDDTFVVLGDSGGALRRWDFHEGKQLEFSSKHESAVKSIVFTAPDRVLSVDAEGWICESDAITRTLLRRVGKDSTRGDHTLSAQPNGRTVLSTEADGTVLLWSLGASREMTSFVFRPRGSDEIPVATAVLPDNRTAVIGVEGLLSFWDLPTAQCLSVQAHEEPWHDKNQAKYIERVFALDNGQILCGSGKGSIQRLYHWDARTFRALPQVVELQDRQRLSALQLSADRRFAIGFDLRGDFHVWDALTLVERPLDQGVLGTSPVELRQQMMHKEVVLALSTPTPGISLQHAKEEMILRLQDPATGEELRQLRHPNDLTAAACSADERWLVVGDQSREATFWDIGSLGDYESFATRLASARTALDANPQDAEALRTLGDWYAFRGEPAWGAECLEAAAGQGAKISRLTLARCHWRLNDFDAAEREFNSALAIEEAPSDYLQRCIGAVQQQSAQASPWRDKVKTAAKAGQPVAALTDLLSVKPYDPELHAALANVLGAHGQFADAAAEFDKALEIRDEVTWIFQRGCLRLYAGDEKEYREDCDQLYESHLRYDSPTHCNQACRLCLLQAGAVADVGEVLAAIDAKIKAGPTDRRYDWDGLNMGMAEYRMGHFDAAIPWLESAGKSSIPPAATITAQLFEAMANFKAGRAGQGKEQLKAAQDRIDAELSKDGKSNVAGFENWPICQIIRREAEALIH